MNKKVLITLVKEYKNALLLIFIFLTGTFISLNLSIYISTYFYILFAFFLLISFYLIHLGLKTIKGEYRVLIKKEKYLKDGRHLVFFNNKSKQLKWDLNIKNGQKHGSIKFYYENGQIRRDDTFINGKGHGLMKSYYENGQIKKIYNCIKGKKHGTLKEYHQNGLIKLQCDYKNGKLNGEYMSYHENGELEFQTKYNNGIQSGETKSYYNNGNIYRSFKLSDGNYEGEIKEFHKNGNLKFVSENKNYTFYKNNNIACEIEYSNPPKGIWKNYRDDGTIEYELDFNIKYSDRVLKTVYTKGGDIYSKDQYGCEIKSEIEYNFSSEYAVERMEAETIYIPSGIIGPPGISGTTVNLKRIESIDDIIKFT